YCCQHLHTSISSSSTFCFKLLVLLIFLFFFFTTTPPTEIYTLSLHDALPIFRSGNAPASFAQDPASGETTSQPTAENCEVVSPEDRKSTRLNSSHVKISYAVFCLKKKK